eukprot:CAMPEP_0179340184 /NCGR_PEP_ID=MMETSP0797-20121207/69140_1 /TAXON_ID=47934 /ORGANISM="Dinophysis acuminata, Strain DAEP01" /LENGTH=46 /DNA_ID= /DNA_START= /DNA_END= /DNA_ORIENTATION=
MGALWRGKRWRIASGCGAYQAGTASAATAGTGSMAVTGTSMQRALG